MKSPNKMDYLNSYKTILAEFDKSCKQIEQRIQKIISIFCGITGTKLEYWYFANAKEGSRGHITNNDIRSGYVSIYGNFKKPHPIINWYFTDGFDLTQLNFSDQEIADGIQKMLNDYKI